MGDEVNWDCRLQNAYWGMGKWLIGEAVKRLNFSSFSLINTIHYSLFTIHEPRVTRLRPMVRDYGGQAGHESQSSGFMFS